MTLKVHQHRGGFTVFDDAATHGSPRIAGFFVVQIDGEPPGETGSISDAVSLADVISGRAHRAQIIAEALSVTDAIVGEIQTGETGSITESVSTDDLISAVAAYLHLLIDNATTTDAVAGVGHYAKNISETVTIGDVVVGSTAAAETLEEATTISDLIESLAKYETSLIDATTITDTITGDYGNRVAVIEESLSVTDAIDCQAQFRQTLSEYVMLGDLIREPPEAGAEDIERVIQDVVKDTIEDVS